MHIAFLILPEHPLFCLVSALDVMRHANRWQTTTPYKWSLVTVDDAVVADSNGISLQPTCSRATLGQVQRLFVVAGFNVHDYITPHLQQWLQQQADQGVVLGGISNGGFVLADAGLLDRYEATVHWEDFSAFCAQYPQVLARYQRFVRAEQRLTCSGGTATLDLFLELIRQDHGLELAERVAKQMLIQGDGVSQLANHGDTTPNIWSYSPKVQRVLMLLDASMERSINFVHLARDVGSSSRTLYRQVKQETGFSPRQLLLQRRLQKARLLITKSHLSIAQIASAVGFSSQAHLTRYYRQHFEITPGRDRKNNQS